MSLELLTFFLLLKNRNQVNCPAGFKTVLWELEACGFVIDNMHFVPPAGITWHDMTGVQEPKHLFQTTNT